MTDININSDLGESFGAWTMGNDAEVLKIVRTANVACGFHASDPVVMVDTVKLCAANGVSIGAHPGFPDLQGFGRRAMKLTPAELEAVTAYQIGALQAIAAMNGAKVTHVKPHGMMANMSTEDEDMALCIARAIRAVDRDLIFLAQAQTVQVTTARKAGLRVAEEVFADRTYGDNGLLTPRRLPNAMIHGPAESLAHVKRMVEEQAIFSLSGKKIPCRVDSVCVHGDGADAVATARAVREGLEASQIRIVPLTEMADLR